MSRGDGLWALSIHRSDWAPTHARKVRFGVKPPPPRLRGQQTTNPAYTAAYRKAQRERWLRLGIVKPRDEAERRIAESGE